MSRCCRHWCAVPPICIETRRLDRNPDSLPGLVHVCYHRTPAYQMSVCRWPETFVFLQGHRHCGFWSHWRLGYFLLQLHHLDWSLHTLLRFDRPEPTFTTQRYSRRIDNGSGKMIYMDSENEYHSSCLH
jgi:hypothetical protein